MELFRLLGTIAVDNKEANKSIDDTSKKAGSFSETLKSGISTVGKWGAGIGKAVATMTKVSVAGIAAVSIGIAALTKTAVENYAEYEQLVGGVETLFKNSSNKVVEYANNAYKTAGLSANEYMETVTSFSASLLQSLDGDTEKAADKANMAIVDMADNANKMGTSIGSIQNAYQGFAKQNFTMLDNLKLGYGGTQEEMQRLLADAEKISGIKYDMSSYADVVDAIHVIQDEMGITGTTSKEASETISGSIASMKSAWTNFMTGMADDNQNFDTLLNNLIDSVVTVADNLAPRIIQTIPRIVEGLSGLIKGLVPYIPKLLKELVPALVSSATLLIKEVVKELPNILETLLPGIGGNIGKTITGMLSSFTSMIKKIMPLLMSLADKILPPLLNFIDELFPVMMSIIEEIMPVLIELIEEFLPPIMDIVKQLLPVIVQLVQMLLPPLAEIIQQLLPVFMEIINTLMPILEPLIQCLQPILDLVVALLPPLIDLINVILMPLIELFSALLQAYFPKLQKYLEFVATFITTVFNVAVMSIKDIIENVRISFSAAWDFIKSTWESAADFFSGIWDGIKNTFGAVSDWFHDTFSKAWQKVKDVFSSGGKIFDGIKEGISDTFKTVVNGLIGGINKVINVPFKAINKMLNKIRSVGVAGVKPFKGLWDENPIGIPELPQLEKGGVLAKGQVGLLEGNGSEAVVPLEKNTQWLDKIADRLKGNVSSEEVLKKLDLLLTAVRQLIGMQVVLDSGTLVGELTPQIDQQLGIISGHKGRGN